MVDGLMVDGERKEGCEMRREGQAQEFGHEETLPVQVTCFGHAILPKKPEMTDCSHGDTPFNPCRASFSLYTGVLNVCLDPQKACAGPQNGGTNPRNL